MKINKKNSKRLLLFFSNKYFKWVFVPLVLFMFWIVFSLTYSSYKSFTVLQYAHNQDSDNNFQKKRLFMNEKLTGRFKANENNLGIISIRIGDVPRVSFEDEDELIFRIKEHKGGHIIYESKYRSGSFNSRDYFPFGFVPINNSKGIEYDFEIISLKGTELNSIEIKNTNPIYISKYKFSKSEIFKNRESVINFLGKKSFTFINNFDALASSIVFLLPLIFYLIWIALPLSNWIERKGGVTRRRIFTLFSCLLIILEISFYEFAIIGFTLGFLGLWIFTIYINKLKSETTLYLSFLLLLLSLLSVYFKLDINVNKASSFAYYLFLIGFVQILLEHKNSKK